MSKDVTPTTKSATPRLPRHSTPQVGRRLSCKKGPPAREDSACVSRLVRGRVRSAHATPECNIFLHAQQEGKWNRHPAVVATRAAETLAPMVSGAHSILIRTFVVHRLSAGRSYDRRMMSVMPLLLSNLGVVSPPPATCDGNVFIAPHGEPRRPKQRMRRNKQCDTSSVNPSA